LTGAQEFSMQVRSTRILTTAAMAALAAGWLASADAQQATTQTQNQTATQTETQTRDRERIYGSQLMTREERTEHQKRMRELKTAEEREQFRKEHHAKMKERANERGVELPDEPPARGMRSGTGPGMGPGAGAGPGPRGGGPGRQ
jgi:hypothetical protein